MAIASIIGTLIPSPKLHVNAASYNASCPANCANIPIATTPSSIAPPITVLKPDGTVAGSGYKVAINAISGTGVGPIYTVAASDANGIVDPGMSWATFADPQTPQSESLTATTVDDYRLAYSVVGNLVPGYTQFPYLGGGIGPRSSTSVYVSHVNPLGSGPDLVPLYRLSWRCGDTPSGLCDNPQDPGYNPFHVRHTYAAGDVEKANALSGGYKLDGIEGYIFPKSYNNAPQSGMVRLCRLYDAKRGQEILFPGTGSGGNKCYPPFPSYTVDSTGISYYSSTINGTDWIGWVYPNYNGGTPPTANLTSPVNNSTFSAGSDIALAATASGSGLSNVKWYANGIQIASDNTSPYPAVRRHSCL